MTARPPALVLAGSRGPHDPVAAYAGVTHKAMVEVASFSHFEKHAGTHLTYKDFFLV